MGKVELPCLLGTVGLVVVVSFSILCSLSIFSGGLKPLHGMQFENPALGRTLAKSLMLHVLRSAGC